MLRLTTTRIILGFICFRPIHFTGRPGHQQRSSATPCFHHKSHGAGHECGRASKRSLSIMHLSLCGRSSAPLYVLGPAVSRRSQPLDDVGEFGWEPSSPLIAGCVITLSSSHPCRDQSTDVFETHTHAHTQVCMSVLRACCHLVDQKATVCGTSMFSICMS